MATAANANGRREIPGLEVTPAEDGAGGPAFLRGLVTRGLGGVQSGHLRRPRRAGHSDRLDLQNSGARGDQLIHLSAGRDQLRPQWSSSYPPPDKSWPSEPSWSGSGSSGLEAARPGSGDRDCPQVVDHRIA
ncbi:hypothetical protein ACFV0L_27930 [Streptosporangium canum]|uniref:hypothetical protein n=1 Tax=Streptosporangium canum TaxID=324952 RepID=UPI0036C9BFBC